MARGKVNSIEKIMSKALTVSDISQEDFKIMINEKQNYLRFNVSIGRKYSQLDEIETDRFIEHGIEIRTWIFKQNERQSLKLKTKV